MKNFSSLVVFLTIFLFMGGVGRAEQHDRLLPLLGNMAGWQAPQAAKGTSLISAQMKMISATRVYSQAEKNFTVNVMVNSGPVLDTDLQESSSENETIKEKTRQIDGFWVKSNYNKKSGSGELIVYLDYNQETSGLVIADYSKMTDEEALQVIKKLDWKKFKKVVSTLL